MIHSSAGSAISRRLGVDGLGSDELVQHLVRALVRRISERAEPHRLARKPLLDVAELGVRCLLLPIARRVDEVLSSREREIARMVGLGYTNRSIAAVLDISLYTFPPTCGAFSPNSTWVRAPRWWPCCPTPRPLRHGVAVTRK
jgi:hypothetical protein